MDFINSAIQANKKIFDLANSQLDPSFFKKGKMGAGGDLSSKMDIEAEKIFFEYLLPFGTVNSEESGRVGAKEGEIVLDPLDGSDNFLSALPYFGTSVAYKKNGFYQIGIICNLSNGDIFLKEKDKPLLKSKLWQNTFVPVEKNPHSCVGIFERAYKSKIFSNKLKFLGLKYRTPGAFALSLAYARNVDFVLYEGEAREYDKAAGMLMCEDLYTMDNEKLVLVSKDKETFDKLSATLLGQEIKNEFC